VDDQKIIDSVNSVRDAASFIAFLEVLRVSWEDAVLAEKGASSNPYASMYGWENTNIGSFLDAAIAGGTDNRVGLESAEKGEAIAWRQAAEIILLGKTYE